MSERPKQRSSIARRAFLAALIGQLVLLAGLSALLYWAYVTLDTLLPSLLGAPAWIAIQNIAIGLSLDLAPYAGGLLIGLLVLMWLLARWASWWRLRWHLVAMALRARCRCALLARSASWRVASMISRNRFNDPRVSCKSRTDRWSIPCTSSKGCYGSARS